MKKRPIKKTRVLLIEAHPAVHHALNVRLRSSALIEIVGAARHAAEGHLLAQASRPDVVVLGLQGSDHGDLGATMQAVANLTQQNIAVLVVTSYADEVEREMLLQAGASRYLLKDINTPQLIAEIVAVAATANSSSREAATSSGMLLPVVVNGGTAKKRSSNPVTRSGKT